MRLLRGVFLATYFLGSAILPQQLAQAQGNPACRAPASLAEMVAASDLIVVVAIERRNVGIALNTTVVSDGIYVQFLEVLKRPFLEGFDPSALQYIHQSPKPLRWNELKKAVAFLSLRADKTWSVVACGLLPLDEQEYLYGACNAISDLFGHDRFLRERRCLLAHPAAISLTELKSEINRMRAHAHRFEGKLDIVGNFTWQQVQPFQRVLLRARAVNRIKLLPFPVKGSELVFTAYLPSELFEESEFAKLFRPQSQITVTGTWFEGNFVIDAAKKR